MDNKETQQKNTIEVEVPTVNFGSSAKGQYKYEVHDKNGLVYDSGGWKPNLILDCGLDKLADMPWAQTFQWAVVGTDPTPTVEKYEDTRLRVQLFLDTTKDYENVDPDYDDLLCWQQKPPALIMRAEAGCREAPLDPYWQNPSKPSEWLPNVPEVAFGYKRSFGKRTEIGKTMYLRDLDLQFRVLSSAPQYTVKPITIELEASPVSGTGSGLSAVGDDGWTFELDEVLKATGGSLPVAPTEQIYHPLKGMVLNAGQGYLSAGGNGCVIPMGNPNIQLINANGSVNQASGISVTAPAGRAAAGSCTVRGNPDHTGLTNGDITITDVGDGYGYGGGAIPSVSINMPVSDAHRGPWSYSYTQGYGGLQYGSKPAPGEGIPYQSYIRHSYGTRQYSMGAILESGNWKQLWGSQTIDSAKVDEKLTLPDGTTGFIGTSGINNSNKNVVAAQMIFAGMLASGEDNGHGLHDTSGKGTPNQGSAQGYRSSGWQYNSYTKDKSLSHPYSDLSYSGNAGLPAKTIETMWNQHFNEFNGGDAGPIDLMATQRSAILREQPNGLTYYENEPGNHVTTCDPDNGIYLNNHANSYRNNSNNQYMWIYQSRFYQFVEYKRDGVTRLTYQGTEANSFDQVVQNQCKTAQSINDAILKQAIGLIDPAVIADGLTDDAVIFQVPTKNRGSSIKNWVVQYAYGTSGQTHGLGPSHGRAGMVITNGQLNKGVNSIGQGAPHEKYPIPLDGARFNNSTAYTPNLNVWGSYIINNTEYAKLKAAYAGEADRFTTARAARNYEIGPKMINCQINTLAGQYWGSGPSTEMMEAHTDEDGAITWIVIYPKKYWEAAKEFAYKVMRTGSGAFRNARATWPGTQKTASNLGWDQTGKIDAAARLTAYLADYPTHVTHTGNNQNTIGLPNKQAPVAICSVDRCKVSGVEFLTPGMGYKIGERPAVSFSGPSNRPARIQVHTDNQTGSVSAIKVLDGGEGYTCQAPAVFTFPKPPPQTVQCWDLQVKPINTYENINNNYYHKRGEDDDPTGLSTLQGLLDGIQALGAGGDFNSSDSPTITHACDIYNTEQTYLGQGKSQIGQGTVYHQDTGGYRTAPERCGPCHFVDHGTELTYLPDPTEYNKTKRHLVTHNQYKTHGWYVTGISEDLNSQYCGTSFLSSANQISMVRTFDFYMELQPVTYTEIGFKEAPAARELFSRIVFDDPIRLRAGQFLRIAYQLLVTQEPGPSARYREVPAEGSWWNGERVWRNENIDQTNENNWDGVDYAVTRQKVLSGYECIQGNGMCIVDERGIASPYDITGFANEPFAPGTYLIGPQYGYVNRWKNGDTRLSFPTREYNNDISNPWILGGDQMNPPDWGIKFFDSPTQNYRPLNFRTYFEWPGYTATDVPLHMTGNSNAAGGTGMPPGLRNLNVPAGLELTFERDAFVHWFTPTHPQLNDSILWTNFTGHRVDGNGRWDFLYTKKYVREVYPQRMFDKHVPSNAATTRNWFEKYEKGELISEHAVGQARSGPGVWMAPVIEWDGDVGALRDPTTVSTVRGKYTGSTERDTWNGVDPNVNGGTGADPTNRNELSVLGGNGMINRAQYINTNPYTDKVFYQLRPHNIVGEFAGQSSSSWRWSKGCDSSTISPIGGAYDSNQTSQRKYCFTYDYWANRDLGAGSHYLYYRGRDPNFTNIMIGQRYMWNSTTINTYGGGWETIDSWKPWTHTPRISSAFNATSFGSYDIRPDTCGNWAQSESIPCAGSSAFISTSWDDFEMCGEWRNRSHTLFGAVSGEGKPLHDFDRRHSRELEARIAGGEKIGRSPSYRIDQDIGLLERDLVGKRAGRVNEGHLSFETPTYLNDYKRLDHKRLKYAEWETSFGNLTGVRCIGLGPTSTTLNPTDMTDAARFNTYVFKFGNFKSSPEPSFVDQGEIPIGFIAGDTAYNMETENQLFGIDPSSPQIREGADAFNNRTTYKLKATFQFSWYRDLR